MEQALVPAGMAPVGTDRVGIGILTSSPIRSCPVMESFIVHLAGVSTRQSSFIDRRTFFTATGVAFMDLASSTTPTDTDLSRAADSVGVGFMVEDFAAAADSAAAVAADNNLSF